MLAATPADRDAVVEAIIDDARREIRALRHAVDVLVHETKGENDDRPERST